MTDQPEMKDKEFGIELIRFYKEFLLGTSKSVEILAEIERKHPKEYQIIRELKDDPKAIILLTDKLPDDVRKTLLSIMVESSVLAQRMNMLFELSQSDKEKLSKDIKTFSEKVEKDLTEMIKNAGTNTKS